MRKKFMFKVSLVVLSLILVILIPTCIQQQTENEPFYVGVTFCGETSSDAKLLIDKVKNYTNLFVLQSGPISKNESATTEICDYAVKAGLNIIVYFGWFDLDYSWQVPWLDLAKQKWGDYFLGIYYYDEPGGIQLDYNWSRYFEYLKLQNSPMYQSHASAMEAFMNGTLAKDYDLASKIFVERISNDSGIQELKKRSITSFTSDYALYWFDYLGGYDVMLAQLGWNDTLSRSIGLVRGAANMQNKPWGAIITWKYDQPPYLDTGEEIYKQMVLTYEAGAKYLAIFNYPCECNSSFCLLKDEHFRALEQFWMDAMIENKIQYNSIEAEAALVMPINYGWGMRSVHDRTWYWQAGERGQYIWDSWLLLSTEYNERLDIVYDDPRFPVINNYRKIYYWNVSQQ